MQTYFGASQKLGRDEHVLGFEALFGQHSNYWGYN